jgi:hypothetical protein
MVIAVATGTPASGSGYLEPHTLPTNGAAYQQHREDEAYDQSTGRHNPLDLQAFSQASAAIRAGRQ